ncbi:hydroxymethylglutaryl-CoA synthase [Emergomyces africanus]|uniref:Hydroxymethylglutaryl-CoA synthase n=1 Tax=Emergomyces africanus TaxID=1955775 RepID=A0A1B7P433_9EURO|nr:hydroxymethylglutaryl-CoA synthase [Emergomyces africanus]
MSSRPQNIGIKAIEIYFPSQCVDQAELEKFDGVSQGKYTIGLGQTKMSFCDDREDIYSMCLTTLSSLLRKYSVDPKSIGRLEVGTETILDKSKSVKSVLMQLFAESGNTNVEGVDTVNACYGGTNAIFNSVNWVESSAWDGRDAIVVTGDIALYKKGAARPTGGAGCIAMLIGPDAPIVFEPGLRGSHITHVYDFYKPDLTSEYPYVDGHYSIKCYMQAVDACYKAYNAKEKALQARAHQQNGSTIVNGSNGESTTTAVIDDAKTPLDRFDHMVFHAPTCKLVAKCYARLLYNDYITNPAHPAFAEVPAELRDLDLEASLSDRSVEKAFMALTKKRFNERVQPSIEVPTMCGNMYCASVYGGLVSLLTNATFDNAAQQQKRIGIFSYGSGLASSMFSVKVVGDVSEIVKRVDLKRRLAERRTVAPEVFDEMCLLREHAHLKKDFVPVGSIDSIAPGTYYLTKVDDMFRREYEVKP